MWLIVLAPLFYRCQSHVSGKGKYPQLRTLTTPRNSQDTAPSFIEQRAGALRSALRQRNPSCRTEHRAYSHGGLDMFMGLPELNRKHGLASPCWDSMDNQLHFWAGSELPRARNSLNNDRCFRAVQWCECFCCFFWDCLNSQESGCDTFVCRFTYSNMLKYQT